MQQSLLQEHFADAIATGHVYLEGKKSRHVYYSYIEPKIERKGTILFVHGMGEQSDDYLRQVKDLVDEGYAVVISDAPSHGRSFYYEQVEEDIVHMDSVDEYTDALKLVVEEVKAKQGKDWKGIDIIGHSAGNLTAIKFMDRLIDFGYSNILSPKDINSYSTITPLFRFNFFVKLFQLLTYFPNKNNPNNVHWVFGMKKRASKIFGDSSQEMLGFDDEFNIS